MTAEDTFEELRLAMLAAGYTKEHQALQSLARLRKLMRDNGYSFQVPQSKEQTEVKDV